MARIAVVKADAGFRAQGTRACDLTKPEGKSLGWERGWGHTYSPVPCLGCSYQCSWTSSFPSVPVPILQRHPLPAHPSSPAVNCSW